MNNSFKDSRLSISSYGKIFFPKAKAMASKGEETSLDAIIRMDLISQDTLNTVMEVRH